MRYPPTLQDNVRQIVDVEKRIVGGRQGPTTIRAGETGIVFRTADGKSTTGGIRTSSDGKVSLIVDVFGAVQDIRNPINVNRESIDYLDVERQKQQASLNDHEKRITDNRSSITWLDDNKASQAALNVEAGRITWLDQNKASNASVTAVNNRVNDTWNHASDGINRANAAQSRADNAYSRAGDALSSASNAYDRGSSALSRANDAYDLAQTAVSRASQAVATANSAAARLDAWINQHD